MPDTFSYGSPGVPSAPGAYLITEGETAALKTAKRHPGRRVLLTDAASASDGQRWDPSSCAARSVTGGGAPVGVHLRDGATTLDGGRQRIGEDGEIGTNVDMIVLTVAVAIIVIELAPPAVAMAVMKAMRAAGSWLNGRKPGWNGRDDRGSGSAGHR